MGTTGLTAQARGAGAADEVAASLGRALFAACALGAALVALQWPIRELAFALGLGLGVQGVAAGTLAAELIAAVVGIAIAVRHTRARSGAVTRPKLVGRAVGAGYRAGLVAAIKITTAWASAIAALLSAAFALSGAVLIDVLTVDADARAAARTYLPWMVLVPVLDVWAFQLDGIFIGATRTTEIRNAMLASLAIFLAAWWRLLPLGNHGLWAAFYVHYFARTGTLLWYYPRLVRSVPV